MKKMWLVALAVLAPVLGGNSMAWAGWEYFTDYSTEDIYGWVDVPTQYTVDVPDYGWVNQGAATTRVTRIANGVVVLRSVSQPELERLSASGTRATVGSSRVGQYTGNRVAGQRAVALTGLKGREAVSANRPAVSRPAAPGQGAGAGTLRGRDRSERDERDERGQERGGQGGDQRGSHSED